MDIPKTRYAISQDGAHIAYQVFGAGDVDLLWIHPWFSHLEVMWEYPPIAQFHRLMGSIARVIWFDQRGIGLSDRTMGIPDLETRMDDLRAVLDATGSERTVLWGGGPDGGALCAMFAATHPDRVIALAFWNASARTAWAPDYPWGMPAEQMRAEDDFMNAHWGLDEDAAEVMRLAGAPPDLIDDPEGVRWAAKAMRFMAAPGDVVQFNAMWSEIDFRAILPVIHVPTLVLSANSEEGSDEQDEYIASRIPRARTRSLPDLGYMPPWPGNSEAAVAAISDFIEEVRREELELDRVLATVLFTDIVDSTSTAAVMGDAKWRATVDEHDRIAQGLIGRYRGTYRKSTGDGLMATFDGPARAVRCAQALVEAVKPLGVEIRAGAHTGEVTFGENDLAGLGVHVAARVAAMAGDSEVWASSTVKDLTAGSGLTFEDAGEHELKGVPDRWRLYRVVP
jgi:class 3 adenylate cyclase